MKNKKPNPPKPSWAAAIAALLLLGCSEDGEVVERDDWDKWVHTYSCTHEQMDLVDRETKSCRENTSYFGSYCFASAKKTICTPIDSMKARAK